MCVRERKGDIGGWWSAEEAKGREVKLTEMRVSWDLREEVMVDTRQLGFSPFVNNIIYIVVKLYHKSIRNITRLN